jgi:hypothetical protein
MKRRLDTLLRTLILAACALPVLASSAAAQSAERGPALEVFGGYFGDSGGGHPRTFGVRGSYRFSETWAVEAAFSKVDIGGQVWFGDLSAKAYLVDTSRFEIYALGGPGLYRVKFFDETFNEDTVHVGLGAQIGLGVHAYLRPEIRERWLTDDLKWDSRLAEYSLGFGWRF